MEVGQEAQVSEAQIAVHWREEQYYPPPPSFVAQANAHDPAIFGRFAEGDHLLRQGDPMGETWLLVLGRAHAVVYGRDGQYFPLSQGYQSYESLAHALDVLHREPPPL